MKMVQMIPAVGWFAVYATFADDGTVVAEAAPLVCWALLQDLSDEESQKLVGIFAESDWLGGDSDGSEIIGYSPTAELTPDWHRRAAAWDKEEEEREKRRSERRTSGKVGT